MARVKHCWRGVLPNADSAPADTHSSLALWQASITLLIDPTLSLICLPLAPRNPRDVHFLRHTANADLRKRGADIRDIQDVLRHADIGPTQIYTHMAREELRKKLPKRFVSDQMGAV